MYIPTGIYTPESLIWKLNMPSNIQFSDYELQVPFDCHLGSRRILKKLPLVVSHVTSCFFLGKPIKHIKEQRNEPHFLGC